MDKWQLAFNYAYNVYSLTHHEYWAYQLSLDHAEYVCYGKIRNR